MDRPVAAFEEPQVSVASDIDQAFDGAPFALKVHQDRRRNFVPIPGIVGVILEVALDLAGGRIQRDGRRRIEIVSRTLITHPRAAVSDSPKSCVGGGVIIPRDPDRAASGLPLVALRPRLAARFTGRGNSIGAP